MASTTRDAVQHDYELVLVKDCTAAYERHAHEATLYNIRTSFGRVVSAGDIIAIWESYRQLFTSASHERD